MEKKKISVADLKTFISEEAAKYKKVLILQERKKTLTKQLNEMYGYDYLMEEPEVRDDMGFNTEELAGTVIRQMSKEQMEQLGIELNKMNLLGKPEEQIEAHIKQKALSANINLNEAVDKTTFYKIAKIVCGTGTVLFATVSQILNSMPISELMQTIDKGTAPTSTIAGIVAVVVGAVATGALHYQQHHVNDNK
jgi:hypothetical protein